MVGQLVMPAIETDFRPLVKRFVVRALESNSGMETIGQRVRKLREARGMERPEFATAVGMPKTSLQTLEEQPQRSSKYLPKIAAYCGVTTDWLATGKGQREAQIKDALDEYAWSSHFGKFDRKCLSLAIEWLRWQEMQGLESQPERQVERFIAMYRRFLADGGRETAAHLAEIERAVDQGDSRVRTTRGKPE